MERKIKKNRETHIRHFISVRIISSIIILPIKLNNCIYHSVCFKIFTYKGSKPVYSHMAEMRFCEVHQ